MKLNMESTGHIANLRHSFKQYTFLKSCDYTIRLIKRQKYYLIIKCFLFVKKWIHFTQGCFVPIVWKLARWFGEDFKIVNVFSLFRYYLPLEKDVILPLNKLESPSPNNALCQRWLKFVLFFWRRRFFNFFNVFLLLFSIGNGIGRSFEYT